MSDTTVEIQRSQLKEILKMFIDATELLEEIPKMQDQGRLSEVSQHIGAELEARVTEMNKVEQKEHAITELLEEISNDQINADSSSLEDLEKDILGE